MAKPGSKLPSYFEALNDDFRYQLTCIGGFAPVYVAQEISGNRFKISGGTPSMKVSWQIAGTRHDPYVRSHPPQVEVEKTGKDRKRYIHPKEYGVSETLAIDYEEHERMEAERENMRIQQEIMKAEQGRNQKSLSR